MYGKNLLWEFFLSMRVKSWTDIRRRSKVHLYLGLSAEFESGGSAHYHFTIRLIRVSMQRSSRDEAKIRKIYLFNVLFCGYQDKIYST